MISARSWIAAALTAASLGLAGPSAGLAQQPKPAGDDGLEKLLDKLEAKDKADRPKAEDEKKSGDKKPGEATPSKEESLEKLLEKLEAKDKAADQARSKDKPGDKKPGEVAPKDKDLDSILEKLGQTRDEPSPDDKKPNQPGNDGPPPPGGQPKPDDLKGGEKDLDERLRELNGKKDKPKNDRPRKPEDETGPLGQVIKEMRDVEERLGKPDTGEETRKKQGEIVKNLDAMIERMKNAPSQSMAMRMIREGKDQGPPRPPKNGQPGQQPGATADGAQKTKPNDPMKGKIPSDLAKSIWGQLPASLRESMNNVLSEQALPSKEELIRLYYLSLGKKGSNPEE